MSDESSFIYKGVEIIIHAIFFIILAWDHGQLILARDNCSGSNLPAMVSETNMRANILLLYVHTIDKA